MELFRVNKFLEEEKYDYFLSSIKNKDAGYIYYLISQNLNNKELKFYKIRNIMLLFSDFDVELDIIAKDSNLYNDLINKILEVNEVVCNKSKRIKDSKYEDLKYIINSNNDKFVNYDLLQDDIDEEDYLMNKYLVKVYKLNNKKR